MQKIIKIKNLTFSYNKVEVLSDVTLDIEKNSVYGIVGVNGSGKTTLLKIILDILEPKEGKVEKFFDGNPGVVLETLGMFPGISAEKNLKISATIKNINYSEIDCVLKDVNLLDKRKKKLKTFSLGMKQRLSIASALLGNPEIIILDEPTNGLDPFGIIEIREIIKKLNSEGKTVIIASHILTELDEICTHVALINKSKIIKQDTISNIKSEYGSIEKFFIANIK